MANAFDQFDSSAQDISGNAFDQFDDGQPSDTSKTSPKMARARKSRESKKPDSEAYNIPEIGSAPELNELSVPAFKSSLALLLTGDTERLKSSLSEQFGGNVDFTEDEQGFTVVDLPSGRYALNKPGLSAQDIARTVFDFAAFTPAGRAASLSGAVAKSAGTQAAIEGVGETVGADADLANVAMAGALGGVGKKVEDFASGAVRAVTGKASPEAVELVAEGAKRNIPVMTTDVVPPETLAGKLARSTGEMIPFAGTGAARRTQQKARESAVEEITGQFTPKFDEVVTSLRNQTNKVKRAAGNRLGLVAEKMDDAGEIPATNALNAIDDVISDLTAKGRVADEATVSTLEKYKQAITEGQSFRSLDTLRSDFREAVKGDRITLPTRSDAAINKIYSAMTSDLRRSIKSNLGDKSADAWSKAKGVYASEMNMIKKSRLKSVLDKGDVTPETVQNVMFSQKPSEVRNLYRSLDSTGKEAMRGTIMSRAIQKATNAEGEVTPTALATQIGKLKTQFDVAFTGPKGKEIKGLVDVLNATRRAQDAQVATPTGQSLAGILGGYAALTDIAATAGGGITAGTFARVYESPIVRDALLRVANTPKGSSAYDRAITEAVRTMTKIAQAGKEEVTE